jgi:hypothetical protein
MLQRGATAAARPPFTRTYNPDPGGNQDEGRNQWQELSRPYAST